VELFFTMLVCQSERLLQQQSKTRRTRRGGAISAIEPAKTSDISNVFETQPATAGREYCRFVIVGTLADRPSPKCCLQTILLYRSPTETISRGTERSQLGSGRAQAN